MALLALVAIALIGCLIHLNNVRKTHASAMSIVDAAIAVHSGTLYRQREELKKIDPYGNVDYGLFQEHLNYFLQKVIARDLEHNHLNASRILSDNATAQEIGRRINSVLSVEAQRQGSPEIASEVASTATVSQTASIIGEGSNPSLDSSPAPATKPFNKGWALFAGLALVVLTLFLLWPGNHSPPPAAAPTTDPGEMSRADLEKALAKVKLPKSTLAPNATAPGQAPSSTQADSSPQHASIQTISDDGRFGCVDRSYYEKLGQLAADHDRDAWEKALFEGYLTDQCIPFKAGQPVFIEDTAILSGLIKIRIQGDTTEYWTGIEAAK